MNCRYKPVYLCLNASFRYKISVDTLTFWGFACQRHGTILSNLTGSDSFQTGNNLLMSQLIINSIDERSSKNLTAIDLHFRVKNSNGTNRNTLRLLPEVEDPTHIRQLSVCTVSCSMEIWLDWLRTKQLRLTCIHWKWWRKSEVVSPMLFVGLVMKSTMQSQGWVR